MHLTVSYQKAHMTKIEIEQDSPLSTICAVFRNKLKTALLRQTASLWQSNTSAIMQGLLLKILP